MLAIDIETFGRLTDKPLRPITCACLFDGQLEHTFLFHGVDQASFEANRKELLSLLDACDAIVGFNAILFDLEYIKRFFVLPQAQLSAWVQKTLDPYLCMKLVLGKTCSLKALLAMNGLPSKSGSGLEAIAWAREVSTFDPNALASFATMR